MTLDPPFNPNANAAAGKFEEPGFAPVPRIQIVTVQEATRLRDRTVQLAARRTMHSSAPPARRPGAAGQARPLTGGSARNAGLMPGGAG